VLPATCLVYLVWSVTVTDVCDVFPLASVRVTLMVLPATEATAPWTPGRFAGAVVGEPEGPPGAASLPGGHLPSTAGLTRTDPAVIGWSPWDPPWAGRTLTQLPAVTSVSAAGLASLTFVDAVKSTVALPFFWVTWAALPDTDAISPLTCAWPVAGGTEEDGGVVDGGAAVAPGELVLGDVVGLDVFDEPHAAMDSAVTPVTAMIANRASRGGRELTDINVSPIVGRPEDQIYRLELCAVCGKLCVTEGLMLAKLRTRLRRGG
jgi:hypothetical protein